MNRGSEYHDQSTTTETNTSHSNEQNAERDSCVYVRVYDAETQTESVAKDVKKAKVCADQHPYFTARASSRQ
jgi:hypothetical protein